jgi:hypothetical protein
VRFPALAPLTIAYVAQLNPKRWSKDPFYGAGYWTTNVAPAGSLAIVPLALASKDALGALGEHLRGAELDHESFHRALITELVERHDFCEEMLDLLAVRAVDAAGQHGADDLRWLAAKTDFGKLLRGAGGVRAFATRVDRLSERKKFRSLYVANAGRALFDDEKRFAEWIAYFRGRKLTFDAAELAPRPPVKPHAPPEFETEWEDAASSDDID